MTTPPSDPERPLELDGEGLRALVEEALPFLERYLDSLGEQPAALIHGGREAAAHVARELPEQGRGAREILAELCDRFAPLGLNTAGPGYLAYIPGGGIPSAAVADLVACVLNRYVGVWTAAPALARIETQVVRWLCELVGLPSGSGGFLTSGGSLANFSAVVAARRARLGDEIERGVLYASSETHHSLAKAALLAGFRADQVQRLPADARYRLRLDALADALARDRAEGRAPFFVCGNAGTTNCGAVDPLRELAELAAHEGLWLHVDAAYGGFFMLTERGRRALAGIERADSVTLDPHKGLFLPYGTGCLVVRRFADLRASHEVQADYLQASGDDPDETDASSISPELTREFRGLRLWLPLLLHGVAPFRANLDEKLDLARAAAEELRALPGFELVSEPTLSLFAFRLAPAGLEPDAVDRLNRRLLERVNARGRVYLTATRLGGRYVLRICVLSFRTHEEHMRHALDALREEAAALLAEL